MATKYSIHSVHIEQDLSTASVLRHLSGKDSSQNVNTAPWRLAVAKRVRDEVVKPIVSRHYRNLLLQLHSVASDFRFLGARPLTNFSVNTANKASHQLSVKFKRWEPLSKQWLATKNKRFSNKTPGVSGRRANFREYTGRLNRWLPAIAFPKPNASANIVASNRLATKIVPIRTTTRGATGIGFSPSFRLKAVLSGGVNDYILEAFTKGVRNTTSFRGIPGNRKANMNKLVMFETGRSAGSSGPASRRHRPMFGNIAVALGRDLSKRVGSGLNRRR